MLMKVSNNRFFYHDFHASSDIGLKYLDDLYPYKGYCCYFRLIELLGQTQNSELNLSVKKDLFAIFSIFKMKEVEALEILNSIVELDLVKREGDIIFCPDLKEHLHNVNKKSEIYKKNRLGRTRDNSDYEEIEPKQTSKKAKTKDVELVQEPIQQPVKQDLLDDTNHFPEHKEVKKQETEFTVTNLEPQRNFCKNAQNFFSKLEEEISSEFEYIFEYKRLNNKQEKIAYKAIIDLCNSKFFDYLEHSDMMHTVDVLVACLNDKPKLNKQFFVTELWNEIVDCFNENDSLYEIGKTLQEIHNGKDNPYPDIAKFEKSVDSFNKIKLQEIETKKEMYAIIQNGRKI